MHGTSSGIEQGIRMQREGNLVGAEKLYREQLAAQPDNPELLHYLGLVNFQLGRLQAADQLMSRSLKFDPSNANTLSDLGTVRVKAENYQSALALFMQALKLDINHIDALNNMAVALKKVNQTEQAVTLYERLTKLRPRSASAYYNLADAQYQVNEVTQAIENYQKAIKLEQGNALARVGLGEAYESIGKFRQAKLQYLSALRQDDNHASALFRLLQLREGEIESQWIERAHQLADDSSVDSETRVRLNIALGYYYDRNKVFNNAFQYFQKAYDEQSQKEPYDSLNFTRSIDKLIDVLTAQFFKSTSGLGDDSKRPIFIVGMPRSGTTLIEQILASHSEVVAGGELSTLPQISYQSKEFSDGRQQFPDSLVDLGPENLATMAKRYLDRLQKISTTSARVTDKLPFNFMHLGTIARLFPNAKIIHCRRHPLDNCLSCYFTSFADQIKFASHQETLGQYYLDYHRLMEHWRKVLPIEIYDLQYESLIADTGQEVRQLLAYCQLGWEDDCLSFYQTNRGVHTPSRWQVRQPIYTSSMQRWKNYDDYLGPLKGILAPLIQEAEA